ncbi:MAG: hypothetical protein N2376_06815 [Clostridia bacterium]|nr:hypothetical protein [Clostridia bacterium]
MTENLAEFLFNALVLALFVLALVIFLLVFPNSEGNLQALTSTIHESRQLVQHQIEETYPTRTGGQLLFSLYQGLETDIIVDGTYLPKGSDAKMADYISIAPDAEYTEKWYMDTNGRVNLVVYTKK